MKLTAETKTRIDKLLATLADARLEVERIIMLDDTPSSAQTYFEDHAYHKLLRVSEALYAAKKREFIDITVSRTEEV